MIETRLLFFGVIVVLLFSIGLVYTIKEFKELDQEQQKEWREKSKDIQVDEDFET